MDRRALTCASSAAGLMLAGLSAACVPAPPVDPAVQAAIDRQACVTAGIAPTNNDALILCSLLQQQDRRLDALQRRLSFIESQISFGGIRRGYPYAPGYP